jgi:hypothetical protein
MKLILKNIKKPILIISDCLNNFKSKPLAEMPGVKPN